MHLTEIHRRLGEVRRRFGRLVHDQRAVAMIETAFTVPTLAIVGLMGVEVANLAVVNARVSNVALAVADNASRIAANNPLGAPQVREVDINDVFAGGVEQASTLNLATRGRIILSSLQRDADGKQRIKWQRCFGALAVSSAYGPPGLVNGDGSVGLGPPSRRISAPTNQAVMFVEVVYQNAPMVLPGFALPNNGRVEYEAAYVVRDNRDMGNPTNPAPTAPVSSNCSGTQRVVS